MLIAVSIAKNQVFKVEATPDYERKSVELRFVGLLDEFSDMPEVWNYVSKLGSDVKAIEFDLESISRINSGGVEGWIKFLTRVQARMSCTFKMVSIAVATQCQLLPMLGKPGTEVHGICAPYFCAKCELEVVKKLLVSELLKQSVVKAPGFACDQCSLPLQFDENEAVYFSFLRNYARGATVLPRPRR